MLLAGALVASCDGRARAPRVDEAARPASSDARSIAIDAAPLSPPPPLPSGTSNAPSPAGGDGAARACDALDPRPPRSIRAMTGGADSPSDPRLTRAEGALVALAARAREKKPIPCLDKVEKMLMEVSCERDLRCKNGVPLSPAASAGAPSDQREAVCTREEIERALVAEVERTGPEAGTSPPRVAFYALATLTFAGRIPDEFTNAHRRRQYRIAQPQGPLCAGPKGIAPNMRCRCDEAELREMACRGYPRTSLSSGYCQFDVDDARTTIKGSIGTEPP